MLITSNGYYFIVRRSSSNAETMLCVLRCITFRCFGLMMRDCKCSSGPGSSVAEMLKGFFTTRKHLMISIRNIMMCMERQLSPQASGTFEVILSSRDVI